MSAWILGLFAPLANNSWQCSQCGAWFTSETPSQTCGAPACR